MATRKKSAFQTVTTHLGQLTRAELEELQRAVAALLEATVEEEVSNRSLPPSVNFLSG